jgi:ribose 5-phosphate isomerase B
MKVHIASDHGGYELKEYLKRELKQIGYEVIGHGDKVLDPNDDYTDYVIPCAKAVADDDESLGIVIGRSGQGEAIAANKIDGAIAAVFYGEATPIEPIDANGELSTDPYIMLKQTRMHNHANIISLGAIYLTHESALKAVRKFLETEIDNTDRHRRRVEAFERAMREQYE